MVNPSRALAGRTTTNVRPASFVDQRISRLDPARTDYFRRHRLEWEQGLIRLEDFVDRWKTNEHGERVPLWYAEPLGLKVKVDKATIFEQLNYRPSKPACLFHASTAKVSVYSGGARAGKSLAAAMDLVPVLLTPDCRWWLVGPEYGQCQKEFDYLVANTIEHPVLGPALEQAGLVKRYANRPHQGDMEIVLDYGPGRETFVRVKSAKILKSLLSEELDGVTVVEASEVPEIAWTRYLSARLITRHGVAKFPSSPSGMGWVAKLYAKGIAGEPGYFAVNCDARMNPTVSEEEVLFWAQNMTDEDWAEQVEGKPQSRHGLVYHLFDPFVHVHAWRDEWPLPSWRRGRAIDFGYSDPFVVLWIAEDEDRRLYVYRELYKRRQLLDDIIAAVQRAEGWPADSLDSDGRRVLRGTPRERIGGLTIGDWDAQNRAELMARGLRIRRANKDIVAGARSVGDRLTIAGDGRPRLYISPDCKQLIREMQFLEWDKDGDGPKAGQDDHACDALRYWVHTAAPSLSRRRPS